MLHLTIGKDLPVRSFARSFARPLIAEQISVVVNDCYWIVFVLLLAHA